MAMGETQQEVSKEAGSDSEAEGFDFAAHVEDQRKASEPVKKEDGADKKRRRGGNKQNKRERNKQKRQDDLQDASKVGVTLPVLRTALHKAPGGVTSFASLKEVLAAAAQASAAPAAAPSVQPEAAPAEAPAAPEGSASGSSSAASRPVVSYDDALPSAAAPVVGSASTTPSTPSAPAPAVKAQDPKTAAAVDRVMREAIRQAKVNQALNKRRVFVTNLSFKVTEDDIRAWLAPAGEIADIKLSRDKATTHPLGFGHVLFTSAAGAKAAVEKCDKTELHGRVMRIAAAGTGQKLDFDLPTEIKEDIKNLMRDGYEGKNISCIKQYWQKRHDGTKLDTAKWGFKNFSGAMKTVEGVSLEIHLEKTLTYVAFFTDSEAHKAYLEEKKRRAEAGILPGPPKGALQAGALAKKRALLAESKAEKQPKTEEGDAEPESKRRKTEGEEVKAQETLPTESNGDVPVPSQESS